MKQIDTQKPVLVTGGSGYIASWIIKYLLEEGYTVHTTVRDLAKKEKYAHLQSIANSSQGTLKVFAADLLEKDSFLSAMQGCELIMHTASPFFVLGVKDAEKQLLQPAKDGTGNVLETAKQVESVGRVVLTSSCAAIYGDNADVRSTPNNVFTEEYWNTSSSASNNPYAYSKTIAEKEAWKIAETQNRWDLLVINPAFVLGPSLTKRTDSTSIKTMLQLADGTYRFGTPELWFGVTDVRDVARAHILAGFTPEAKGRHIITSDSVMILDIASILAEKFGHKYPFPQHRLPYFLLWLFAPLLGFSQNYIKNNIGVPIHFDNSYTKKDLGLEFRKVSDTVIDHFQQILDDGLLRRR
ncbi:MAG: aldehyde reductase [Spirochaetota bacterium]